MSARLEKLEAMAARKPDDAFTLYGLAMEYKGLSRHGEAAATFSKLLDRHPGYIAAYLHYGRTLLELGREAEAVETYRKGIELCRQTGQEHARAELEQALGEMGL